MLVFSLEAVLYCCIFPSFHVVKLSVTWKELRSTDVIFWVKSSIMHHHQMKVQVCKNLPCLAGVCYVYDTSMNVQIAAFQLIDVYWCYYLKQIWPPHHGEVDWMISC